MFTLRDFSDKILKPSIINAIKSGRLDSALADPDCMEIIMNDAELNEAAVKRVKEIFK